MTAKIAELPAVVTPADTDLFEVSQSNTSKRVTRSQIVATRAAKEGVLGGLPATTETIDTGAITPTSALTVVDTESAASTDDLETVVQTNFPDGGMLLLSGASADRVVTIIDAAGGDGQILLADSTDLALSDPSQYVLLRKDLDNTSWIEVMRSWGNQMEALRDWLELGDLATADAVGATEITDGEVTAAKLAATAVTPGSYTSTNLTVDQQGRITAASSGSAAGGLVTSIDANTAVTLGDAVTGTHRLMSSGSAITLTLDAQAAVGTRVAATPAGAGAVTVAVESGAGFWLPGDDIGGTARAASFGLAGYGYFECIRNSDDDSAEWFFAGDSDHGQTLSGVLDAAGFELKGTVSPLQTMTGALSNPTSGRSWKITGNTTGVPVTDGWNALVVNQSAASRTITPASGGVVGATSGEVGSTVTVLDDTGCSLIGDGTNLIVFGPVTVNA